MSLSITDPTVEAFVRRRREVGDRIPVAAFQTDVPRALWEVADEKAALTGDINLVTCYTPDPKQVKEQEHRVYHAITRRTVHNPTFTYPNAERVNTAELRPKLNDLLRRLGQISPETRAGAWYARALDDNIRHELHALDFIDGMCGRTRDGLTGDALSKRAIANLYWGPDPELLARAQADCRRRSRWPKETETHEKGLLTEDEKKRLGAMQFDANRVAEIYGWCLKECGLLRTTDDGDGFGLVATDEVTAIDVKHRDTRPTVYLPTNRREMLNGLNIGPLADHEIGGHACQTENGWKLLRMWGRRLTGHDETLYEALAMVLEALCSRVHFGTQHEERPYPYVYPTAVYRALRGGSFFDVVMDQFRRFWSSERGIPTWPRVPKRNQVSKELWEEAMYYAWRAAYRIFRSMRDTRNPLAYAMWKDLGYARGEQIQWALEAQGLGHYNRAATIPGEQGLLWLAEVEIRPEDVPHRDLGLGERLIRKLLGEGATAAF